MTCKNATLPEILELSPRLEDADPGVRRLALIELADLELPEALPLLVAALRGDPDPGVRGEAARLLEAWEEDAVVDALCAALADPVPAVADAAAQSLGELKEPAAGRRLLPWLGHADAFVRASVLRALRELRLEESAVPALAALGDPQARCAARRWRYSAGSATSRPWPNWPGWPAPMSTGGTPGGYRRPRPEPRATVLPALCAALADAQWQVREEAATTLASWAEEAGEPLLKRPGGRLLAGACRARAPRALAPPPGAGGAGSIARPSIGNLRKEAALALGELADPASARFVGRRRRRRSRGAQGGAHRPGATADAGMTQPPLRLRNSARDGWLMLEWADGAVAGSTSACAPPVPVRNAGRRRLRGRIVAAEQGVRLRDIRLRGYGVQLLFDDGHERGIYPGPICATNSEAGIVPLPATT